MGGTTKTKIIYSVYTSATNQRLAHYLTLLVENGSWRFDGKGFTIEGKEEKRKEPVQVRTTYLFPCE
jgi:hypothetical protein